MGEVAARKEHGGPMSLLFRVYDKTDRAIVQSFYYMNWFNMLFQIDFLEES